MQSAGSDRVKRRLRSTYRGLTLRVLAAAYLSCRHGEVGDASADDDRDGGRWTLGVDRFGWARPPGDQRARYDVGIWLTRAQKKKLDVRARDEMRSMGNYVTKLVLEYLRG